MGKIRRSKKQILASQAQAERMKLYWEKKRAKDEVAEEKIQKAHDISKQVQILFNKVYMAGWNRSKVKKHRGVFNMLSVEEAGEQFDEIIRRKLEL